MRETVLDLGSTSLNGSLVTPKFNPRINHRNGILTSTDGGTYIGQFVNGLREGIGTFTYGRMTIRHGYVLEGLKWTPSQGQFFS